MINRRKFITKLSSAVPLICSADYISAAVVKRELPRIALDFISQNMTLMKREDWTKTKVKTWMLRGAGDFDRITIHHSGQANEHSAKTDVANYLDGILVSHSSKGYGDIGYHFMLDYTGRVWEGRSLAYEGAHVAEQNENNIGIMLLGNFEEQTPAKQQVEALDRMVQILRDHYAIKKHRIYGHRDLGQSLCPGANLYAHVQTIKS